MKKGASFQFHNQTDTLDIHITDVIDNWWGYGKTAFIDEITKSGASKVNVVISSPGGNVDDALAMYDFMIGYNGEVNTFLTGIVASAATIIALGGKKVTMSENALFMIHNVSSGAWGTAKDMRDTADVIDMVEAKIVNIYAEKTGMSKEEIQNLLDAETWMDASMAKALGFADVVSKGIENKVKVDATNLTQYGFTNYPQGCYNLINYENSNKDEMEKDKKEIGLLLKLENLLNKVLGNKADPKEPEGEGEGGEGADEFHKQITAITNKVETELQDAISAKATFEAKATDLEKQLAESETAKTTLTNTVETLTAKVVALGGNSAAEATKEDEPLPGAKAVKETPYTALLNNMENGLTATERAIREHNKAKAEK